jgi:hypothetical protein
MPSADFCCTVQEESLLLQSCFHDMQQTSRGKFDRLQCTIAGLTATRLDGYGLCCPSPTRPRVQASYPVLVHRDTLLLHASFRLRLATTPSRFANPSPPSGRTRDSHPQTVEHAGYTMTPRTTPGLEIASAIPHLRRPATRFSVSCQVCWRRKRWHHGLTVDLETFFPQGSLKTDNLNRTRANRIPSRPGVVKHPTWPYTYAQTLPPILACRLRTRRRTVHTDKPSYAAALSLILN